jgi:hypothetical protein
LIVTTITNKTPITENKQTNDIQQTNKETRATAATKAKNQ